MPTMPMFPLGAVLLPGEPLALQVFEPRYVALVQDIMQERVRPEFGVVLISRGSEVGGADERTDAGVVAHVARVQTLPGERYRLQCVGGSRIRVVDWLPDDPYPLAEVEDWPDEPESDQTERDGLEGTGESLVAERLGELYALAGELAARTGRTVPPFDPLAHLPEQPSARSYALTTRAGLGDTDRQAVLSATTPGRRLALLAQALQDRIAALRFQLL